MSTKFQLVLSDQLATELKTAARRLDVPLAQFVRDTMAQKLQEMKQPGGSDPFASFTAILDIEDPDLAARVDDILYR